MKPTSASIKLVTLALTIALLLPLPAQAGVFSGIFNKVLSTITSTIGGQLTLITSLEQQFQNLQQQTLYPLSLINSIRSWSGNLVNSYRGWMSSVYKLNLNSAQLLSPSQLEAAFTSGNTATIASIPTQFTNTYGTVPSATAASPGARQMMDMSDALAQDALKQTVASDAASASLLAMADTMEDQATVAPGTASYVSASAYAATLQTLAYQHKLLAAQLREEAATLAHQSANLKQSVTSSGNLQQTIQTLVNH